MTRGYPRRLGALLAVVACGVAAACAQAPAAAPTPAPTASSAGPLSAAAATPVAGVPVPGVPLTPASLSIQLDWIPNIQHFGPVYADQKGFYKDLGLDVKVQPGGQGVDGLQMVAAGAAVVAISGAPQIYVANEQGLGVVAFAAVYQKSASALVCRGDRGINTFKDIAGKTIGSKGPADMDTLPPLLGKNGVDFASVKVIPIGASSVTEIIAGVVDCQLAFAVNEPITLQKAGITPVVFNLADYGFGGQAEVYITRQDYLAQHPDVLVRFLQATGKAWGTYLDDPQAAAAWIVDNKIVDGLDVDQQKAQAVAQAGLVADDYSKQHGLLALNPELWQEQAQQTLDQARITQLPDMEKAMTSKILDAAALPRR